MTKWRHIACWIIKAHVVSSRRSFTTEARAQSKVSPCEICGGQSNTWTGFSPGLLVVPSQYHSISASYSS